MSTKLYHLIFDEVNVKFIRKGYIFRDPYGFNVCIFNQELLFKTRELMFVNLSRNLCNREKLYKINTILSKNSDKYIFDVLSSFLSLLLRDRTFPMYSEYISDIVTILYHRCPELLTAKILNDALKRLSEAGLYDEIIKTLIRIKRYGLLENTLNSLLNNTNLKPSLFYAITLQLKINNVNYLDRFLIKKLNTLTKDNVEIFYELSNGNFPDIVNLIFRCKFGFHIYLGHFKNDRGRYDYVNFDLINQNFDKNLVNSLILDSCRARDIIMLSDLVLKLKNWYYTTEFNEDFEEVIEYILEYDELQLAIIASHILSIPIDNLFNNEKFLVTLNNMRNITLVLNNPIYLQKMIDLLVINKQLPVNKETNFILRKIIFKLINEKNYETLFRFIDSKIDDFSHTFKDALTDNIENYNQLCLLIKLCEFENTKLLLEQLVYPIVDKNISLDSRKLFEQYSMNYNNLSYEMWKNDIELILSRKKVVRLLHFTNVLNLSSMFKFGGIIPRYYHKLYGIKSHYSDELRIDKHLKCISLSVSFPNSKMLFHKRKNSIYRYAILEIDPIVLSMHVSAFFKNNAASLEMTSRELYHFVDTKNLIEMFESEGIKHETFPVDTQAEILFLGVIPIRFISKIIVHSSEIDNDEFTRMPSYISNLIECDDSLFTNQH